MRISSTRSFAAWSKAANSLVLALVMVLSLAACDRAPREPDDEIDVLVIGAGIAGLAAALEATERGARVTLVEMNSVGGGHAVMAGGLFLVNTPLQKVKGIEDSVELAVADMMAWGEDADATWVQWYAQDSLSEVHNWLTNLGVRFAMVLPAPGETSVPRFHFTEGTAVNVVVPMMRVALGRAKLEWRMNSEATSIGRTEDGAWTVDVRNLRSGQTSMLQAPALVIATGGFEGNLTRVRENWLPDVPAPDRLLNGAGHFADGTGLDLGAEAGAATNQLNRHTIFVTGLPDPRDPDGVRGLLAMNPAAIFVDSTGRRFMNESASRKVLETTVLAKPDQSHWLVFDNKGRRRLQVRGASWLRRDTIDAEILGDPGLVQIADELNELAMAAGLPPAELELTVAAYNARIVLGEADEFGRFGADQEESRPPVLDEPPFFALRLYPMSRKSLGGLAIDGRTRVVDAAGNPIPGLYAAGEAAGVAGINGSHGGSGTFLGPSVYTGRIAGRTAAKSAVATRSAGQEPAGAVSAPVAAPAADPMLGAPELDELLTRSRPGYWHFEQAHALVREREWRCTDCHGDVWGTRTAGSAQEKRAQLESCARCH